MAESSSRRPRRIRNLILFLVGITIALSAAIGLTARPRLEHWLRTTVIATLEKRLGSRVELQTISIQLGPVTKISGGPLTIRHRGRLDVAPLVHLDRFETTMTWRELLRRPRRVDTVALTGLEINIPPSAARGTATVSALAGAGDGKAGWPRRARRQTHEDRKQAAAT